MIIKEQTSLKEEKKSLEHYRNAHLDIVLTEEQTVMALFEARKKQYHLNKQNEYWDKVRAEPAIKILTSKELYKIILKKEGFVVDIHNRKIVKLLCRYFTKDKKFEEIDGFSLSKGLMLYGDVGCGKTYLMKLFSSNMNGSYVFIPCNNVAVKYSDDGYDGIKKYFQPLKLTVDAFGHKSYGICFDDLGTEKAKKHYGNAANVMEEIILDWYQRFNAQPERLHLTTNMSVSEIEAAYGTRVRSRMREMFNVIVFNNAPDRRK